MSSRFPAPWRIVEMPRGYAVEDADGQQLGVFYGRSDQNAAGHTGFLTMEEARQMALNFAKLSELLEQMSARSEIRSDVSAHAAITQVYAERETSLTGAPPEQSGATLGNP